MSRVIVDSNDVEHTREICGCVCHGWKLWALESERTRLSNKHDRVTTLVECKRCGATWENITQQVWRQSYAGAAPRSR